MLQQRFEVQLVVFSTLLWATSTAVSQDPAASFAARTSTQRIRLVVHYGGTSRSEESVALALRWLAAHQSPDGGWRFGHGRCPGCDGKCTGEGTLKDRGRNAATALALLPFLGAGQTDKTGEYQQEVRRGLEFLLTRRDQETGSLLEPGGTMYSHGLATLTLCEAYGLAPREELRAAAQAAIDFIVRAQDPQGGGWRYMPKQPGDQSVTGVQWSALHAGVAAGLKVPADTFERAAKFLDSVQQDDGARYGYTTPGSGPATSASGLVCRLYQGWKPDRDALARGAKSLVEQGPSLGGQRANMYYNYYATQACFQVGGDTWVEWNQKLRDPLIAKQSQDGHALGSWRFDPGDAGSAAAGRLYDTVLSALVLETYYRWPRGEER